MRITCTSLDDFIVNLSDTSVAWNAVYFDRTTAESGADYRRNVAYQASAVLQMPGGGEALLQCGEACGHDLLTADGHQDGTDRQARLHEGLKAYCEEHGLRLKPGIIDE